MTQAPTPGPLSVGDRVVAVADLRKRPDGPVWVQKGEEVGIVREYGIDNCIAGVALQDGREGDWAKSCFRLAPTAPVEASGSEREEVDRLAKVYADATDYYVPFHRGLSSPSSDQIRKGIRAILAALRPQPSEETREAVARIIADHVAGGFDAALQDKQEWKDRSGLGYDCEPSDVNGPFKDDYLDAADAILALLSARPLALGGQHSGGEAVNRECKQCGAFKSDLNAACTFCGSTTPARAEAQDEGAEMTRLLKLADSALANVTAFEDDARYIMGNTNYAITENARSEIRSFLLAQSAKTSVRPKALEILERLLDHSGARGSFDAMKHGDAVKDAEELLRSARSPGHTDLMVTPESIDAYMRVNPMEAQDEGAALSASDRACYEYPGKNQSDLRAAFVAGACFIAAHPSPTPAADADRVRKATGAEAIIRHEQIVISIDVDALPGILSGSIATNSVSGLFKVTDPAEFAKEVCRALNAEKEDGTTRVHMMFDSAFNHAIDQGAEGVEEVTEDEFEAEAQRIQSEALAALKSEGK